MSVGDVKSLFAEEEVVLFFVMSVRLSTWNNSAPNGRIFMKFGTGKIFE